MDWQTLGAVIAILAFLGGIWRALIKLQAVVFNGLSKKVDRITTALWGDDSKGEDGMFDKVKEMHTWIKNEERERIDRKNRMLKTRCDD